MIIITNTKNIEKYLYKIIDNIFGKCYYMLKDKFAYLANVAYFVKGLNFYREILFICRIGFFYCLPDNIFV